MNTHTHTQIYLSISLFHLPPSRSLYSGSLAAVTHISSIYLTPRRERPASSPSISVSAVRRTTSAPATAPKEFCGIVSFLEKVVRDSKQLVKVGSGQTTIKQLKQRVGVKPTLADCLEGIRLLEEMHQSEYLLKLSVASALPALALKPSASGDLGALQQLLVDQPNIPREEVQYIYDIIFAEEIS